MLFVNNTLLAATYFKEMSISSSRLSYMKMLSLEGKRLNTTAM